MGKVNLKFLPAKAHYFFYWGGTASLWPFIPVLGKQMGISEAGIGVIYGIAPIAGLIAKPVFGAIADRFKKRKMLFLFFILLTLMSFLCIAFLPQNSPERPVQLECGVGQSYIRQCARVNAPCAQTLIQSFQSTQDSQLSPEEGSGDRGQREADDTPEDDITKRPTSSSGSSAEEDDHAGSTAPITSCRAKCFIHGFEEGIHFCNRMFSSVNQPEICYLMRSPNLTLEALSHLTGSSASSYPGDGGDRGAAILNSGPYMIQFDVRLKINQTMSLPLIDPYSPSNPVCLYIPIKEVAFYNVGEEEGDAEVEKHFDGLSCQLSTLLPQCFMDCPLNGPLNRHLETIMEEELLDSTNFWTFGSLVVIAWVSISVIESLADVMCFQTLEDEPQLYGRQRLWGTIGWGIFSLVTGYLIETSSQGRLLKDYTPSFYIAAGLFSFDLIVSYKWSMREVEKTKSLRRDLCSLLSNLRIVVFLIACVIVGMCTGLLWNFLFWYVEKLSEEHVESCESHRWIKILQGLIAAVQCIGELIFFVTSGWLIKKLGHVHCITLVLATFGVRFILYSVIKNPWTILPIELLQGVTYGVFYSTMVSYAYKVSPQGTFATVQGLVQAAYLGVGVATGSLVGGLIFQKYGGGTAFRVFGIGCIIFSGIHALIMCILNKKSNYGFPSDRTEPEGQEMFKITSSNQDVAESDEGP